MTVVPPPSPVYDLIAIELALAALILWMAVSVERRFHRLPIITAGVLFLIILLGHEHVWPPLMALARMIQAMLDTLDLLGMLALTLVPASVAVGYPALRHRLQRRRRRPEPSDDDRG